MSVESQTIQGLKWTGIAKFAGQLISWVVTLIVLRLLMPDDYGLMAIVTVVISILGSIAEMGLGSSIVQATRLDHQDLAKISGLVITINVAAFLMILLLAPLAEPVFREPRLPLLLQVASLQFLLNAVSTVQLSVAYRDMAFKWLAGIEIAAVATSAAITLGLAWYGAGVWALVIGSLAQAAIRTLLLLRRGFVWPHFTRHGVSQFLAFGGSVALCQISWQIIYQSDLLIAGLRLTADAVGLYAVSLHLATLPMQKVMGVVNQVAFPAIARLQVDMDRLRARLVESSRYMAMFSVAVMWGLSSVAPEFVRVVLGEKWSAGTFPLQVICLIVPLRFANQIFTTAALGVGKAAVVLRNSLVSGLILPLCFLVGTYWGIDGLALSWLAALPLAFIINFPRMTMAVGLTVADVARAVWSPVAAGVGMYGAVVIGRLVMGDVSDSLRLPVLVTLGAVVYLGLLNMLNPGLREELKRVLRAAR